MQTQVMFYQLPENTSREEAASADKEARPDEKQPHTVDVNSVLYQACLQASYFYRQGQRVFIYSEDQAGAEAIDEMLWAFDTDSFVPHNLAGEGPKQGSAVEISFNPPKSRRAVLINLTRAMPTFANQFSLIVDFVPTDATLKQQARERFKTCRQWGFHVDTQAIAPMKQVAEH